MLDPDVYSEDGPDPSSGSNSGGSSSRGGTPPIIAGVGPMPTGGTGTQPTPTGGQGGGMPTQPSAVSKTCQNYCSGYATKCPAELEGQNCQIACEQEMTSFGDRCEKLGLKALKCLTPYFKKDNLFCQDAINAALTQCNGQVQKFQSCKGVPTPTPQPEPNPMPNQCMVGGEGGPGYCKYSYGCPTGNYTVTCGQTGVGGTGNIPGPGNPAPAPWYTCSCYDPSGVVQTFQMPSADPVPCHQAASICGITSVPLK